MKRGTAGAVDGFVQSFEQEDAAMHYFFLDGSCVFEWIQLLKTILQVRHRDLAQGARNMGTTHRPRDGIRDWDTQGCSTAGGSSSNHDGSGAIL